MKKEMFLIAAVLILIVITLASSQLGYDNPNLPSVPTPTPTVEIISNATFNESLTNALYWKLDGTNAPPTAAWDMNNFGFNDLGKTNMTGNLFMDSTNQVSFRSVDNFIKSNEIDKLRVNAKGTIEWTIDDILRLKFAGVTFQPENNNEINLGTSSSQFNNIFTNFYFGNGSQLTDVCLSNGTNCQSVSTSNIFDQDLNTTSNVNFGNITILNNLSVDGNTFFVDNINNRIGIGTTFPTHTLNIIGDANVTGDLFSYGGGLSSTKYGIGSSSDGKNSLAIGFQSSASLTNDHAIGRSASASGQNSLAIGRSAIASAKDCNALGSIALCEGQGSFALGTRAKTFSIDSFVFGKDSNTSGLNSIVFGADTSTDVDNVAIFKLIIDLLIGTPTRLLANYKLQVNGSAYISENFTVDGFSNFTQNATFAQDVIIDGTLFGGSPVKIDGITTNIINYTQSEDSSLVLKMYFNNNTLDNSQYGNDGTNNNTIVDRGEAEFDGVDDFININNTLINSLSTTTKGTWTAWVKPVDATPTDIDILIQFSDTNVNEFIHMRIKTDGIFRTKVTDAGIAQWQLDTDNVVFADDTWVHIALVQDGTEPVIYIDGIAVAQTFSTSTDKTAWFNDLTGLDNGRIGDRDVDSNGETNHFNGTIDEVKIYNRALSASEVKREFAVTNKNSFKIERLYTSSINIQDLQGTYSNGEAYVCVFDNGTIFAKDSACS